MRVFVSAGEPSGDLHGSNLIGALRRHLPGADFVGFGGSKMIEAGCRLYYPLCDLAVMGVLPVLAKAPTFLSLIAQADRIFAHHRPDVLVLIDFPGFHWWLARRAKRRGIPVIWFVPPQLWAWAGWRVKKMRRWVDLVLCSLPFEADWYQERGVNARLVGHPYFDELAHQQLDATFEPPGDGRIIALLPGSRDQEVERNFPSLLRAATLVHAQAPETRFLVACYKESHRQKVEAALADTPLPIHAYSGKTPEIIAASFACMSVSGSVSLELLYHGKPSVILYRINRFHYEAAKLVVQCPYITLVNLLAGTALFPEYPTYECPAESMAEHVLGWLNDAGEYDRVCRQLEELKDRTCRPGATLNAAAEIARFVTGNSQKVIRPAA